MLMQVYVISHKWIMQVSCTIMFYLLIEHITPESIDIVAHNYTDMVKTQYVSVIMRHNTILF